MASATALSLGDKMVLSRIFDPESSASSPIIPIDSTLPSDPHILESEKLQKLQQKEVEVIKSAETAIALPDSDNSKLETLLSARAQFDVILRESPSYASAYNNRAQLNRIVLPLCKEEAEKRTLLADIHSDLSSAIRLSAPAGPAAGLSPRQAKILSQALTQRGTMYFAASSDKSAWWGAEEDWKKEDLESLAQRDFFEGGRAGSEVAREMAVRTNPFAKLCGSILKEAMKREGVA